MSLKVSYSGVRGIVGESLTAEVAERYGRAFGALVSERNPHPTLLLARDTRPSGPELLEALIRGLPEGRLLDLGVVATPTIQCCMQPLQADGALMVTASHNPSQWNGFKFFLGPENTVLDGAQTERLQALVQSGTGQGRPGQLLEMHERALELHLERVLAQVDGERIRRRALRVAVDAGGGAGEELLVRLLERLGCFTAVVRSGRESEPTAESLKDLCQAVLAHGCQLGLAQDLDGDRLALVTEQGRAPGEESTLVLVVEHVLSTRPGPAVVVKNLTTTRAVNDVAARHGARVVETRVGEVNLSRALARHSAEGFAFGGEGNGGVIFPPVSLGRDSLVGTALVLECLASDARTLSQRLEELPFYHHVGNKLPLGPSLPELFARLEAAFPEATSDRLDGLRLSFADGSWLGVRPSNTEPIVRVVAESRVAGWPEATLGRVRELA